MYKWLAVAAAGSLLTAGMPTVSLADSTNASQAIAQGVGKGILQQANYFGNTDPSTQVTVDIVMKLQNQDQLAKFINQTTTPGPGYRNYLSTADFAAHYAPSAGTIQAIRTYLSAFGIQSTVYKDNLVITATGTVGQFNNAFSVTIQNATFKGKHFHGTMTSPKAPASIANSILCILGLSDYSNLTSQAVKLPAADGSDQGSPSPTPTMNMPSALVSHYDVQPLYDKGAEGQGQTIGIVTLADFNPSDAYTFWNYNKLQVKPNRIHVYDVDGGSELSAAAGSDETSLDVEQSGSLAPQADINVYVGPNTDTGFADAFAKAISDDTAQQISVSWGESETLIDYAVQLQEETPQYANVFNELFMEGAAQGQSLFAAAGDSGAYAAERDLGTYNLSVLNPADSPYITAAGGTTWPYTFKSSIIPGYTVTVSQERAWGWDYLYDYWQKRGLSMPGGNYFVGGGGGFSEYFATPDYQQGVPGVNTFTAVQQWDPSSDYSTATYDPSAPVVTGTGSGRNLPDLSMNADPEAGYGVYYNLPDGSGWNQYGGTSFVAPQLAGLSALINSADHTRVGFWNPQIYHFAQSSNSPLTPLNQTGTGNDNIYYTGTPGTLYNQATGLGTPDIAALAQSFASRGSGH